MPDPTALHPIPGQPRVVLLKPLITSPLIEVGEFSYYDDPDDATAFETRNVLYHYGPDRLVIGRFCALGEGVRFIMNGANHRMDGPSTLPLPDHGRLVVDRCRPHHRPARAGATPWWATTSGSATGRRSCPASASAHAEAIVASGAVVVDDVPDYGIVRRQPGRLIRRRYGDADVDPPAGPGLVGLAARPHRRPHPHAIISPAPSPTWRGPAPSAGLRSRDDPGLNGYRG